MEGVGGLVRHAGARGHGGDAPSPTRSPACAAWPWNCCWSGHPPECGTCQKYLELRAAVAQAVPGGRGAAGQAAVQDCCRSPAATRCSSTTPTSACSAGAVCGPAASCARWACSTTARSDGEFYIYTAGRRAPGRGRLPLLRSLRRGLPHRGHPGQGRAAAGDKNRKAALVPCKSTCPAEIDVPRYVRFIKEGDYAARRRGDQGEGPLPAGCSATSATIPARAMPPRRGQRAHRHQGAQALRGGAGRRQRVEARARPPRTPPASGWRWWAPARRA